jgi:hypothetical protein
MTDLVETKKEHQKILSTLSRKPIVIFTIVLLSVLIIMSALAASAALSMGLLSSNNNSIKAINHISSNNLKVSREISGASVRGSGSNRRFNIALIKPTFTAAAYNSAFYKFYFLFIHASAGTNITTHLNLLSSKIPKQLTPSSSASTMSFLPHHLKTLLPKSNVNVLTDVDVDTGSIFVKNGITSNRYDIMIIGHQEYVTQREYNNLKQFVANGGTLIVLDGIHSMHN